MDEQLKLAFDFSKETTTQIIALSTAIITFTVAFSKDVIKSKSNWVKMVLIVAWVLYLVSIVFGVSTLCSLTGVLEPSKSGFSASDIASLKALAIDLKTPVAEDKMSQYLGTQLSSNTWLLLSNYNGGLNTDLQRALGSNLNQIIHRDLIYAADRLSSVELSAETWSRLEKYFERQKDEKLDEADLLRLNELLLIDAYPETISTNLIRSAASPAPSIRGLVVTRMSKIQIVLFLVATSLIVIFGACTLFGRRKTVDSIGQFNLYP